MAVFIEVDVEAKSFAKVALRRSGWPDYPEPTRTPYKGGWVYEAPVASWRVYRAKRRRYLIPGDRGFVQ